MTQEERDQILLDLKEHSKVQDEILLDLKEHNKVQDEILLDLKEHNKIQDEILLDLKEHNKIIDSKLAEHDEQFKSINSILKEHTREIRSISRSVARIEEVHGGNIQALLDVTSGILEKLNSFEKHFESNDKELEDHDNRIWNLESNLGII